MSRPPEPNPWNEEALAWLGSLPDSHVAWLVRLPIERVRSKRESLGRPEKVVVSRKRHPWKDDEIALLGEVSYLEIAKQLNISAGSVAAERKRRSIPAASPHASLWTPEKIALLGKIPDTEISKQLGIPVVTVTYHRKKLGIPRAPRSSATKPPKNRRQWTDEEVALSCPASLQNSPQASKVRT